LATAWNTEIWALGAETGGAKAIISADTPDKQLVDQVLAGDETAFEQIFERHKRLVARVASRFFRQSAEIEEIIQITFTKVYFGLENFRGKREFSLPSFLARVATNACLDLIRTRNYKSESFFSELNAEESASIFEALRSETGAENDLVNRELVEKLLSRLAAEDRALLEMLDAEEMTVKEVAQITGWSDSKIKIKAHRARNALRKILGKFL
jgi:RNA polymerase sigma-70 factor (ECF subfamily)